MEKENISAEPMKTTMQSAEEYRVERIEGKRLHEGKLQYLVKWYDYPDEDNTWEPLTNCMKAEPLIYEYEAKLIHEQKMKSSCAGRKKKTKSGTTRNAETSAENDIAELSERCEHLCICKAGSTPMKVTANDAENNLEKKKELLECCDNEVDILGAFPNDLKSLTLGIRIKGKTEDEDICYFDKNEVAMLWPYLYISFLENRITFREE